MTLPVSPELQKLLDRIQRGEMNFPGLMDALYASRFSGAITLHCLNGIPRQVDLGSPIRLSIVEGEKSKGLTDGGGSL